jgi:ribosomal RNA-processing protein 12
MLTTMLNNGAINAVTYTMLDLLVGMCDYLDASSTSNLYTLSLQLLPIESDSTLQKKGYKCIEQLYKSAHGQAHIHAHLDDFLQHLASTQTVVHPSSKKVRLSLLLKVIPFIADDDVYFIDLVLPEAVIGTKENNERTRSLAYQLVTEMGKRMQRGGSIHASKLMTFGIEGVDAVASLERFIHITAAGLAGGTPHMISATVESLSKLLFEFKADLSPMLMEELLTTLLYLLQSPNREIVKSVLSFIKVAVVSMPLTVVEPHVDTIVKQVLRWSNQDKSSFRVKARYMMKRLVRKFGFDHILACAPEETKKIIVNIRKRSERAKRQQAQRHTQTKPQRKHGNAFEDALYGSESEYESDDQPAQPDQSRLVIRQDDDEDPLDFLDSQAATRMTAAKPQRKRRDIGSSFQASVDGRLLIPDSDDDTKSHKTTAQPTDAPDYYMEAVTSKDGFTRGERNKIKFSNKKQHDSDDDTPRNKVKPQQPKPQQIGKEYRSKKASGDVKKKGKLDPYAYIPLDAKRIKKRGKPNASIATMGIVGGKKHQK